MNEQAMLDWEGNLIEKRDRSQIIVSDVCEDTVLASSVLVSSLESTVIDGICQERNVENVQPSWKPIPQAADEVASILGHVSPLLDDQALHDRLQARTDLGKFQVCLLYTSEAADEGDGVH